MTAGASPISFGLWNPAGAAFPIKYSLPLLHEIEFFVSDAYRRISYGGLEVGGLLYGAMENDGPTLLAYQPIECQHQLGPSFTLSESDVEALRLQVAKPFDHELHGQLMLAGWFISHCRSDLKLTAREFELFDELFPGPRQITMLVKPEKVKPTRYGFLVRPRQAKLTDPLCYDPFILPLTTRQKDQTVASAPASVPMPVTRIPTGEAPAMHLSESAAREVVAPVVSSQPIVSPQPLVSVKPEESVRWFGGSEPAAELPADNLDLSNTTKIESHPVLTPTGEEDSGWFGEAPRRKFEPIVQPGELSGELNNPLRIPRWLEIGVGLSLVLLSMGAVLWTYLNFLLPPIPLRSDVRDGLTVVTWPPELTKGAEVSLTVWTGAQRSERVLTSEEKRLGSTVLADPGADSTVQLRMHHWAYVRSGQIRLVQVKPAPPPPPPQVKPVVKVQKPRRVAPDSTGQSGETSAPPALTPTPSPVDVPPPQPEQPPEQ